MQPTPTHAEVKDRPPRQRLSELKLPPEVAAEVRETCARYGWYGKVARQRAEDKAKLQYFFGGQDVAYLTTREGGVVAAAGGLESDEFGKALDALSPEERARVVFCFPRPWHDQAIMIGPFVFE